MTQQSVNRNGEVAILIVFEMGNGNKSPGWPSTLLRIVIVNGLLGAEAK